MTRTVGDDPAEHVQGMFGFVPADGCGLVEHVRRERLADDVGSPYALPGGEMVELLDIGDRSLVDRNHAMSSSLVIRSKSGPIMDLVVSQRMTRAKAPRILGDSYVEDRRLPNDSRS